MIEPHKLEKANWNELAEGLDNANIKEDDAKAEAVTIKAEMLIRLEREKITSRIVDGRTISKNTRYSFSDTPMEFAEQMGAVKKAKDEAKLSTIKRSGVDVPGAKETVYVTVRKIMDEENTKEIQR